MGRQHYQILVLVFILGGKGHMTWKGKAVCFELDLCACDQTRMLESGAVSFLLPSWLVVQGLRLTEFQLLTR